VVPLSAFDRFIRAGNAAANEHGQRQYTAEALRRLADELRTHGASEAGVDAIRAHADSLRMSGGGPNASRDYARAAFLEVVRELDLLGERRGVPVDTARLRAAAWAISPRPELLAQRTTVQAFFETARDALHALARRR
jgi:hypothetical protein